MSIKVEDYYPRATFQKMKAFADTQQTPFVVIDTAMISQAYDDLRAGFEFAKVYYAVKANPNLGLLKAVRPAVDGVDISWIVGLAVICPLYYFLMKSKVKDNPVTPRAVTA